MIKLTAYDKTSYLGYLNQLVDEYNQYLSALYW